MKKATQFLLILIIFISCTSTQKKFESDLSHGLCQQAFDHLTEKKTASSMLDQTFHVGGTAMSYLFTGAGYTAEVLVDAVGGTIMFVALCGPMLAAITTASSGYTSNNPEHPQLNCLPGRFDTLSAPPLGKKAYRLSKPLRCPSLDPLSKSLRQVADCFKMSGNGEGIKKSQNSLRAIRESGDFFDCLSTDEQNELTQSLDSISEKIHN